MNYTLSAAAKAAGVAKSTISKAIKEGDLSKVDKVGNSFRIDPAELDRWMKVRGKRSPNDKIERMETPVESPISVVKENALQKEIDMLRDQLDDMKKQRDSWQSQAEVNVRLLEDQSKQSQPETADRRLTLYERITGKTKAA